MPITAFTDIVSLSLALGMIFLLNIVGWYTRIGLLNLAGGMLGVFIDGWIFSNGTSGIVYQEAYDPNTLTYHALMVDPNIFAAIFAVACIASFILLIRLREPAD